MQRGNEIEMLFAGLVVAQQPALQHVLQQFRRDRQRTVRLPDGAARGELQRVVGGARVAIGVGRDAEKNVVAGFDIFIAQPVFLVGERATQQFDDLWRGERVENVDLGAREQRRDYLEGRILRGRADEGDVAGLDVRKKRVLLRFVEAVYFVDENHGA